MLTPTLFDVAAITGLSPLGHTFDPTLETRHAFDFDRPGFQNYMEDHYNKESEEVSDEEHIAFLTLWLSYYMFCPGSLQIAKSYIPLAIQLHEGRRVSLGKLLLAFLYYTLGKATLKLKLLHETSRDLNIAGPMWLLQYWLNATFENTLGCPSSIQTSRLNVERPIEGLRLALMTGQDPQSHTIFLRYVNMFVEANTFHQGMAPFHARKFGPSWFTILFPVWHPNLQHSRTLYGVHF